MTEKSVITVATTFTLIVAGVEPALIEAELQYSPDDPYAVAVQFHTRQGGVEWMFGRKLLADGLLPSGEGDIVVRPDPDDEERVLLELSAPSGFAVLSAAVDEVLEFLELSYDMVMPGEEALWIDFDRELAKLAKL
jgi:hypothetical protein